MTALFKHCSVEGCNRNSSNAARGRRGMCNVHVLRLKRNGNTNGIQRFRGEALEWLKDHIKHNDNDCLKWPYNINNAGYGCVSYGRKTQLASRVMCLLVYGDPPSKGYDAAHSCGKGRDGCVNPNHLRWATRKENCSDRIIHGTANRGEKQGHNVLSEVSVKEIKLMKGQKTQQQIADIYGVSRMTINDILNYRTWSWLK